MEKIDRLSNLPDAIIHKILSVSPIKTAVITSVLSKRWQYHWTHIDTLVFNRHNFDGNYTRFTNIVSHVLRHRHPSANITQLSVLNSDNDGDRSLVHYVLAYAFSRGGLEYLITNFIPTIDDFPSSFSKKLQFASLKTLKLNSVSFFGCNQDYLLSNFKNLENLELISCSGVLNTFNINCRLLASLNITHCSSPLMFVISAPRLKFFKFATTYPVDLNIDKCPILEKAELFYMKVALGEESIWSMLSLAKKLSNAKSLTLTVRFSGAMSGWMLCNNAFDEETRLEEKVEDEPENPWLTIRKLEFYPIARFRQSEVEAALDYVTSFRIEEIEFFGMVGIKNIPIEEDESDEEDEEDESDEEPMLFHNDFSVFLPNLLKSKTLKTLKVGPCSFKNLSSLSLRFKSLTTLQLSEVSIEYDSDNNHQKIIHGCDLFSSCLNLEKLKLSKCTLKNLERLIIKAPRLKFFEFESLVAMQLRFENCSMLEEMKIHYTLPVLIAWRETDYQNKEYFFDMIFTDNGGGLNGKEATSLLKFSMGKFVLCCINSNVEEAKVVMEFNKV
ncbi:hypothetical protein LWI29_030310 [Acer saccharum]|uniref:F-box domain-containing protein n=1 Tax=Acer saccharum TaxID=4024 RepID=A0AA39S8H0_ACESA|nr:hypothetical protein LWI29_030310 [Acer saccharum]